LAHIGVKVLPRYDNHDDGDYYDDDDYDDNE
jgi:hypothetical protein